MLVRSVLCCCIQKQTKYIHSHKYQKVSYEEGSAFARCHRMPYVEASAKQNINVEESFFALTELLYRLVSSGAVNAGTNWEGIKCGLVPKNPVHDDAQQHCSDTKCKKQNCCS